MIRTSLFQASFLYFAINLYNQISFFNGTFFFTSIRTFAQLFFTLSFLFSSIYLFFLSSGSIFLIFSFLIQKIKKEMQLCQRQNHQFHQKCLSKSFDHMAFFFHSPKGVMIIQNTPVFQTNFLYFFIQKHLLFKITKEKKNISLHSRGKNYRGKNYPLIVMKVIYWEWKVSSIRNELVNSSIIYIIIMNYQSLLFFLFTFLLIRADVDYGSQDSWGGDCTSGTEQSPINIGIQNLNVCPEGSWLRINTPCQSMNDTGSGQLYTMDAPSKNELTFIENGQYAVYTSTEINYHHPAEHSIDGVEHDLEVQIVHVRETEPSQDPDLSDVGQSESAKEYAILSILVKVDSSIADDVFDTWLDEDNEVKLAEEIQCLAERFFYHYQGSFTTPDCEESVNWFILREPWKIKPVNLEKIKDVTGGGNTNRNRQNLNSRTITLLSDTNCQGYQSLEKTAIENGYL